MTLEKREQSFMLPENYLAMEDKIKEFRKDWYNFYKKISKEKTPQVDGTGKKIIDKKGSFDYIIAAYMVECLDKHFPGWSWEMSAPIQFVGGEWVVVQGHLVIIDERLLAFGINPPYRRYYGTNAARVTYKTGAIHNFENMLAIDNNVKAANTEAMKVAINRLTHIGDDIYGKRIEEDGMGSLEEVLTNDIKAGGGDVAFGRWVQDNHWRWGQIYEILGVKDMSEIKDFGDAMDKVKKAKGL